MAQTRDFAAQRKSLRMNILLSTVGIVLLITLLTILGYDAFSGKGPGVAGPFATAGLVFLSIVPLTILLASDVMGDSFQYCLVAAFLSLVVGVIVFFNVETHVWSVIPFVLFCAFWFSFAGEYFIGIISRPVEWIVKRAVPEDPRQGDLELGSVESPGGSEVVPLSTVTWEGREELDPDMPPSYGYDSNDDIRPLYTPVRT